MLGVCMRNIFCGIERFFGCYIYRINMLCVKQCYLLDLAVLLDLNVELYCSMAIHLFCVVEICISNTLKLKSWNASQQSSCIEYMDFESAMYLYWVVDFHFSNIPALSRRFITLQCTCIAELSSNSAIYLYCQVDL